MQQILKELNGLIRDAPVIDDEFAVTRANRALQIHGQRETIGAIAGNLSGMITFSLPDKDYDTYAGKVRLAPARTFQLSPKNSSATTS